MNSEKPKTIKIKKPKKQKIIKIKKPKKIPKSKFLPEQTVFYKDEPVIIQSVSNNNNKLTVKYANRTNIEKYGDQAIEVKSKDVTINRTIEPQKKSKNAHYNKNLDKSDNPEPKVVTPSRWVSLQQKRFPSWINETFIVYQKDSKRRIPGKFEPYSYQKFIRDYLQKISPYRGLLMYHGLGSGKTCGSITVAENLKNEKNIIVMLPASLRSNFIKDGLKFCADSKYRSPKPVGNDYISDKYTFVSYNASNVLDQIKKIGSFDNHVVIVDEVHNLISRMVNPGSKTGRALYDMMLNAKNVKYVFLSGTPIINKMYEIGILFNLLRGPVEICTFRITDIAENPNKKTTLYTFEESMTKLDQLEYFKLNYQNRTFEVQFFVSQRNNPDEFDAEVKQLVKISADLGIVTQLHQVKPYTLYPDDVKNGETLFNQYFIEQVGRSRYDFKLRNKNLFQRRMLGLVSYIRNVMDDSYPSLSFAEPIFAPMSAYQYHVYTIAREREKQMERTAARGIADHHSRMEKKTSFSIYTRQICNFVFPEHIIVRPALQQSKKNDDDNKKKKSRNNNNKSDNSRNNNNNNSRNNNNSNDETEIEKINKIVMKDMQQAANIDFMHEEDMSTSKKSKMITEKALKELSKKSSTYLSAGAEGLDKYSPKMKAMLEQLNKSKGLVFIYSQFLSREGIEIFSRVLNENGYEFFDLYGYKNSKKQRYAIYSGEVEQDDRQKIIETFRSDENKYGDIIKVLLVSSAGAEGIHLQNIREVYIMEPYWNEVRIEQVIGRAVRKNSHASLPPEDRNVTVYRFFTTFTPSQQKAMFNLLKENFTTDERIYKIALSKKKLTDEILMTMQEMAVDCTINAHKNQLKFPCFSFGANQTGLSYLTDIKEDRLYGEEIKTKTVKKKMQYGAITNKGKVVYADKKTKKYYYASNADKANPVKTADVGKLKKKVGIDLKTGQVYDFKSLKTGNPVQIGLVNDGGDFVRT